MMSSDNYAGLQSLENTTKSETETCEISESPISRQNEYLKPLKNQEKENASENSMYL